MVVVRVEDPNGGSHIEPPLNHGWNDGAKLEWKAAVVTLDTGLPVRVVDHGRGIYQINVPGSNASGLRLDDAWTYLNGVRAGAAGAKMQAEEESGA